MGNSCCGEFRLTLHREYPDIVEHWRQLSLLAVLVFLAGSMLGIERACLSLFADQEFHVSNVLLLQFVVSFGVCKGIASLVVGEVADRLGRKKTLLLGWVIGWPIYIMIYFAKSWGTVIFANVFLGFNQGFAWTSTIYMMNERTLKEHDGIIMGTNMFMGYFSIAVVAFGAGFYVQATNNYRHVFILGIIISVVGFLLGLLTEDTMELAKLKARKEQSEEEFLLHRDTSPEEREFEITRRKKRNFFSNLWASFKRISWGNTHVFACCQAGFFNSFKDGIVWGLIPLFFKSFTLDVQWITVLVGIYPLTWSIFQLATGYIYDQHGAKWLVASGLWLESIAIFFMVWTPRIVLYDLPPEKSFYVFVFGSFLLGVGTALSYPTLHIAVAHGVPQQYFASAVGIYKWWREIGYACGALAAGPVADSFGLRWAITMGAIVCFFAAIVSAIFIKDDAYDAAISLEDIRTALCGPRKRALKRQESALDSISAPPSRQASVDIAPSFEAGSSSNDNNGGMKMSRRGHSQVDTPSSASDLSNNGSDAEETTRLIH